MTLENYLAIIYIQTTLSGIIVLVCFYRFSSREKHTKLMGLLFLFSFLSNFMALKTPYANFIGSIYDLLLILIASWIYDHVTSGKYRKLFLFMSVIFILFAISNLLFIQKSDIASYNKLFSSFIIILYSIFYFYRLMIELPTIHLQRLPMFWFNSAFLLYHAGTIFLFAFTSYLVHVLNDNLMVYWSFHNILIIIQQLIVLAGLRYDLKIYKPAR